MGTCLTWAIDPGVRHASKLRSKTEENVKRKEPTNHEKERGSNSTRHGTAGCVARAEHSLALSTKRQPTRPQLPAHNTQRTRGWTRRTNPKPRPNHPSARARCCLPSTTSLSQHHRARWGLAWLGSTQPSAELRSAPRHLRLPPPRPRPPKPRRPTFPARSPGARP